MCLDRVNIWNTICGYFFLLDRSPACQRPGGKYQGSCALAWSMHLPTRAAHVYQAAVCMCLLELLSLAGGGGSMGVGMWLLNLYGPHDSFLLGFFFEWPDLARGMY